MCLGMRRPLVRSLTMVTGHAVSDHGLESLRHQVLQLAIVFTCSIGQLSPGAYLLRRDLFPSIVKVYIVMS